MTGLNELAALLAERLAPRLERQAWEAAAEIGSHAGWPPPLPGGVRTMLAAGTGVGDIEPLSNAGRAWQRYGRGMPGSGTPFAARTAHFPPELQDVPLLPRRGYGVPNTGFERGPLAQTASDAWRNAESYLRSHGGSSDEFWPIAGAVAGGAAAAAIPASLYAAYEERQGHALDDALADEHRGLEALQLGYSPESYEPSGTESDRLLHILVGPDQVRGHHLLAPRRQPKRRRNVFGGGP